MAKSISELYINTMRKKYTRKYTAWEPDKHYNLGDYGFLKDNIFEYQGNVTQLSDDFKFEIDKDPTPSDKDYSFGTKKNIKTEGEITIDVIKGVNVSTKFSIEFSNAGSIVYEAKNVSTHRIADIAALGVQIKKFKDLKILGKNGVEWDNNYVVITEIDIAESATIMLSNTKGSEVCFAVKGDIGIADFKLSDPKLGWKITSETGEIVKYIAKEGVTPFFRLMGLKRSILGNKFSSRKLAMNSNIIDPLNKFTENIDFVAVENRRNWTYEE
ncbi:MAG: hypothetical protein LBM07_03145 [Culturomica sp.]|jgi:hypothetical protein|nr:hypothetical protein [Culturomica sp.]